MKKRKIYILLSNFFDTGSKVITAMTGCRYPHASIGLEEDMNTFYTFVTKGFRVEKISRYLKPGREPYPCQLYTLEVSAKVYERVKELLCFFERFKSLWHYSKLGLVLSLLHIPYNPNPSGFFCSQFVAEMLNRSGAIRLNKRCTSYFANDLKSLPGLKLSFRGNMKGLLEAYGHGD